MTNTAKNYISVTSTLVERRGWYHVILSYYDENHIRKQPSKSLKLQAKPGNKNIAKRKAKDVEREFEEKLNTSTTANNNDILYGDYLKDWLKSVKPTVEVTTYSAYRAKVDVISEYFNKRKIKLVDLKKSDIKNFYQYLSTEKQVKNTTIRRYHANIHKSLKDALEMDLIDINPAEGIKLNKPEQYIASFYNKTELEELFSACKGSDIELHILLTTYYGLRRSECCGLKWSCIDFNEHTITISHTVTHCKVDGKYTLVKKDRTKNLSSYRTLPLIPFIEKLLLEQKEKEKLNKAYFGNGYKNKEGYILVNELGELIVPDKITRDFRKILKQNHLRRIRFHDLRHSCASLLLANGISMKEIQQWLGHSNWNTTANIYAHLESNSKQNSANVIAKVLGNGGKE